MNVQLDLETYRTRFVEAQKANLFYCLFNFPSKESTSNISSTMSNKELTVKTVSSALTPFGFGSERDKYPYLVKSANIPSVEFEERTHEIQFITLKTPGFKTYSDWIVTFNIDGDAAILTKFYEWNNLIQDNSFKRSSREHANRNFLKIA